ncbi:hypothetical protein PVK06_007465 [Gossypium arboreum]|uniref:Uncharacterized protein n=1 Tax=Gossypium arboreum TaxID=29729 RepID=A0ABR0QID6_GOSAR|nr:hypothetical protein PVK06_007465 [Gossypium arboreum]
MILSNSRANSPIGDAGLSSHLNLHDMDVSSILKRTRGKEVTTTSSKKLAAKKTRKRIRGKRALRSQVAVIALY